MRLVATLVTATGLSPREIREQVTVPLMKEMMEIWREAPPANMALASIVSFLQALGGKRQRKVSKEAAAKGGEMLSSVIGQGGVGFSHSPLPMPLDPAGLMKEPKHGG